MQLLVGDGPHQRFVRTALTLHVQPRRPDALDQGGEYRFGTEMAACFA
jgi:hypothetical protein